MGLFDFWKKKEDKNKQIPPELQNIAKLLEEVKNTGTLPCHLKPDVLENLKIIANTENWHLMLQGEIINNLNRIYDKWQRNLQSANDKIHYTGKSGGFALRKYWVGTQKEYDIAYACGVIDDNTDVEIIEDEENYHGSWISINANGEIEEYMD